MRSETIARNYADALFETAQREGGLEAYGEGIETVARLLEEHREFRLFLETPRVSGADKKRMLRSTFGDVLPKKLLNFLLLMIDKRRQRLVRDVAREYHAIIAEHLGRVRVEVTVARPVNPDVQTKLVDALSGLLGKKAVPHFRVKPEILGGVIVRAGDKVLDGSVRRRLDRMRRQLLAAELPSLR